MLSLLASSSEFFARWCLLALSSYTSLHRINLSFFLSLAEKGYDEVIMPHDHGPTISRGRGKKNILFWLVELGMELFTRGGGRGLYSIRQR